jgi:hypothetical protein
VQAAPDAKAIQGEKPWNLSQALRRSLEYQRQLLSMEQKRRMEMKETRGDMIIIASDGRLDESGPPSVAVLLYDPRDGQKLAIWAVAHPELVEYWTSWGCHYIAAVEQAAVLAGIMHFAQRLRGRDIIWFEDNSVVLAGLVKGTSMNPELDRGAATGHLLLSQIQARVWFEYIETKSKWSDGASRELDKHK